ncbi:MAG TPA: hypothetical protein VEI57_15580 [Nitrospirota bacterium]|nr:hypothetical protein [Nitrospirota bacterium]
MINKSNSRKAFHILMAFFVLLVTAIIAMSYAITTLAADSMQKGQKDVVKGEVVAIDTLHHLRMLTLRSEKIGTLPNDTLNIYLDKSTRVKICNEREPWRDINVDGKVTLTFHEVRGWLPVADAITERC